MIIAIAAIKIARSKKLMWNCGSLDFAGGVSELSDVSSLLCETLLVAALSVGVRLSKKFPLMKNTKKNISRESAITM